MVEDRVEARRRGAKGERDGGADGAAATGEEGRLSSRAIEAADPRRVYELYDGWPSDAEDALRTRVDVPARGYRRVVYLAVGGSATAGDIISDWFLSSGGVEVSVYRGNVPRMVLEDALVIVCSTSGDTEETLQMARAVIGEHPHMVAISAGGRLRELAEREGIAHVKIKLSRAPRFTLPYSLFASIAALRSASLLEGMEWELGETVATMKALAREVDRRAPAQRNVSKRVAAFLAGGLPCIYATSVTKSVARRFRNSLNENAKMHASFSTAPDFLHNEVEAWEVPEPAMRPVVLRRVNDPAPETRALGSFVQLLRSRRVPVSTVAGTGKGNLAQLMSLCYSLDVASYYAAILRGVEPFEINLIEELKQAR